jgi:hypothetical protein
MNVEIGTEAVQFPEKEYINGIFVAVLTGHLQKAYFTLSKQLYGSEKII